MMALEQTGSILQFFSGKCDWTFDFFKKFDLTVTASILIVNFVLVELNFDGELWYN